MSFSTWHEQQISSSSFDFARQKSFQIQTSSHARSALSNSLNNTCNSNRNITTYLTTPHRDSILRH